MDDRLFNLINQKIEGFHLDIKEDLREVKELQRITNGRITRAEKDIIELKNSDLNCPARKLAIEKSELELFKTKQRWAKAQDIMVKLGFFILSIIASLSLAGVKIF